MIKSTYARSLQVLPRRDLVKIVLVIFIQIGLSILDLIGVALIGILGALAVNGVQSQNPTGLVSQILSMLGISQLTFQEQSAILGITAAATLITRTILSILTTRRALRFLSSKSASISSTLVGKLLSQSVVDVSRRTSQQTLYSLTNGVTNITLGVIGNTVTLIADASLLVVLFLGLLAVDAIIATSTILIFGAIGYLLYVLLHQKAHALGESQANLTIKSNERIVEIVLGFREAAVKNRKSFYAKEISRLRFALSRDLADSSFLPYIGKYVIETTVILGGLIISAIQFTFSNAVESFATLSIFLAAGTRIAPAVLRMQQSAIQLKSALGASEPTLDLIAELRNFSEIEEFDESTQDFNHENFEASVELKDVSYKYPEIETFAIRSVNLKVLSGEFIAIVGLSGAGKSTLADLILGLLHPSSGEVLISGKRPESAVREWSGAIAYVPQDVLIVNGTIEENVTLGFPASAVRHDQVKRALRIAQLEDFIESLANGLNTVVGERGTKLSGGQRQRLGIARALYTNPKLVVFDEATSALDGKTEFELSTAIDSLRGEVTVIMIAHRLATVRNADKIVYLNRGEVRAIGRFEELKSKVPEFESQARIMGL
jgi:ABC-type multidrug transport system fused ATPase/permease subunit